MTPAQMALLNALQKPVEVSDEALGQWMSALGATMKHLDGDGDTYQDHVMPTIRAVADEMRQRLQRAGVVPAAKAST